MLGWEYTNNHQLDCIIEKLKTFHKTMPDLKDHCLHLREAAKLQKYLRKVANSPCYKPNKPNYIKHPAYRFCYKEWPEYLDVPYELNSYDLIGYYLCRYLARFEKEDQIFINNSSEDLYVSEVEEFIKKELKSNSLAFKEYIDWYFACHVIYKDSASIDSLLSYETLDSYFKFMAGIVK